MKLFIKTLLVSSLFVLFVVFTAVAQITRYEIADQASAKTHKVRIRHKINFDKAVAFLNKNELDSAKIYFTNALNDYEHPDAYYNRALTNLRLGSRVQFCKDMKEARRLRDFDADSLYCLKCMKRDTIYYDASNNVTSANLSVKLEAREVSKYDSSVNSVFHKRNKEGYYFLPFYELLIIKCSDPTIIPPSYSGGIRGIKSSGLFRSAPEHLFGSVDNEINTRCKFKINAEGDVTAIEYLKGDVGYYNIIKKRLLKLSKWNPATLNGQYYDVDIELDLTSYAKMIMDFKRSK